MCLLRSLYIAAAFRKAHSSKLVTSAKLLCFCPQRAVARDARPFCLPQREKQNPQFSCHIRLVLVRSLCRRDWAESPDRAACSALLHFRCTQSSTDPAGPRNPRTTSFEIALSPRLKVSNGVGISLPVGGSAGRFVRLSRIAVSTRAHRAGRAFILLWDSSSAITSPHLGLLCRFIDIWDSKLMNARIPANFYAIAIETDTLPFP